MKIFSFGGWSKSGKTTLITRLITELKKKNKKVLAVKNIPNKYSLEPESKDTFKFLESGADKVCLIAKQEILSMKKIKNENEAIDILKSDFKNFDFLILEGLCIENVPLIEVFDSKTKNNLKFPIDRLSAIVSDIKPTNKIPCYKRDDINKITKFMEDYNG